MLNLRALAAGTRDLSRAIPARARMRAEQLRRAAALFEASSSSSALERLRSVSMDERGALAVWEEPLVPGLPIPPAPASYAVAATDGSTLDPDPHTNADYYAINVGSVRIVYGSDASARIDSTPALHADPADLWVGTGASARAKQARDVALERDRAELEMLARVARELPDDRPRVALVDGSLLRWDLEQLDAPVRAQFLEASRASLGALADEGIPVAGYIAASRSREFLSAIQISGCPHAEPPCARCAIAPHEPLDLVDADLFAALLPPGTRSARTRTVSSVLARLGMDVCSIWLHVHGQVVKLELPRSVIDAGQETLLASIVADQLRKGGGYPPVLQEAHEAAVITTGDRAALRAWVDRQSGTTRSSAKSASKRVKRV